MNTKMWVSLIFVILLVVIPVFGEELTKIYGSVPKNGVNKITLDNSQNEKEAVVVFKELNWPIPFAVYLSPRQTGVLSLPSESYQIYYALGFGWDNAKKRFIAQPEYYMLANVLNAGGEGTVHDVKTRPKEITTTYFDPVDNYTKTLTRWTDSDEWTWAESTISLAANSPDPVVPIDPLDFPL